MSARTEEKPNAIERALQILMLFVPHNREAGAREIAGRLALSEAAVSRILPTLTRDGFLRQDRRTGAYRLGPTALHLGVAVKQSLRTNLVEIAKPYVDALRDDLNEMATLEILSGDVTVLAYLAEGTRPLRTTTSLGATVPSHAAAGAKAVLAHLEAQTGPLTFPNGMAKLTGKTLSDPAAFAEQLRTIRERGFAVDDEEVDEGIAAVAVPVFNHDGQPVAALVVVGPKDRIDASAGSALVTKLKQTAEELSADLHYTADG